MTAWRDDHAPVWNAPTLLTVSRMVLAPIAVREILLRRPGRALALLFAAGMTDLLDGFVARATGAETAFGQLLDPVADKLLLSGVFIGLARIGSVPAWFVALVFSRDAVLLIGSGVLLGRSAGESLQPSLYGKASTLFQIGAAAALVGANASRNARLRAFAEALLWPTAILTAATGIHYLCRGVYTLRRR